MSPKSSGSGTKLPRNVVALGAVSFLTDVSSDMIYPLLPRFLTHTLGASAAMLGTIEGAAETVAAFLKLASGWWSDRVRRRKPLVVLGYALAALVRPLVAVAQTGTQVLAIRMSDRVGKGLRTSPRDALIADSVDPSARGRAFGFHRAADNAGATLGPLIAWALLAPGIAALSLRSVFWIAAIPGLLSVLVVLLFVRETSKAHDAAPGEKFEIGPVPGRLWGFFAVLFVFTLGNSTDAFLLLRAGQLGVPEALAPLLWALLQFVKAVASTPGGALSDRLGRRPVIVAGWIWYALIYLGFAFASETWHAWVLFGAYGVFHGLTEGVEKALVADLAPARARGRAFGLFHLTVGLGALPASVLFGLIWDASGPPSAFLTGAALAGVASVGLVFVVAGGRTSK